ncbi:dihydrofolate reductase family protein [Hyphococcus sp.]|jgi:dihydrofolate reductase|uniref:dihydrofolate reductase family protein n=1 Tax=Hyphococcus sp. TaxID=2038636 RepID=UPI003D0E33B8
MRKLILGMFVSLDGFVSGPNGEADWIFKSGDDATDEWIIENLWQAGLLAMGARTFSDMAAYWPTAETPFAAPMNEIPKVVFSKKGLAEAPDAGAPPGSWGNPNVGSGELSMEVARLKAQPGKDIRVMGGASFARALAAQGLVDEYQLLVCSVALGGGAPLFSDLRAALDLKLISAKTFSGGAVALVYRPA